MEVRLQCHCTYSKTRRWWFQAEKPNGSPYMFILDLFIYLNGHYYGHIGQQTQEVSNINDFLLSKHFCALKAKFWMEAWVQMNVFIPKRKDVNPSWYAKLTWKKTIIMLVGHYFIPFKENRF